MKVGDLVKVVDKELSHSLGIVIYIDDSAAHVRWIRPKQYISCLWSPHRLEVLS